jgi:hypothetical protein
MKHLLSGVAIVAVLAIAAPVWAQNSVGAPGPSPGGPGLTPYSGGGAPSAEPPAPAPAPMAMPPSASAPPPPNSAMPPTQRQVMHHHYHHYHHYHHEMSGRIHHGPRNPEDTTAQLNRAELSRIQSGNVGAPPPAEEPGAQMPPGSSSRMPGPKTNGSGYIPPTR